MVDLISYDGEFELFGKLNQFKLVLLGEGRTTRIGRVDQHESLGLVIHCLPDALEIHLPSFVRKQVIELQIHIAVLRNWLGEWEARRRNKYIVPIFTEHLDAAIKGPRSPKRDENIGWVYRILRLRESLSYGLLSFHASR